MNEMETKLTYKSKLNLNDRKNLIEIADNLKIFANLLSRDRRTYCKQVSHKILLICLKLKIVVSAIAVSKGLVNVYDLHEILSRLEAQRHLISGSTIEFEPEYMACIDHACIIIFDIIHEVIEGFDNE